MIDTQQEQFIANISKNMRKEADQPDTEQEFIKAQFARLETALQAIQPAMAKFLSGYQPNIKFPETPDDKPLLEAVKNLEKALEPLADNSAVIDAIKALKLSPVYKPEIKVSPTPVNVAAPNVNVDGPDLKPLEKAIKANKPEKVDNSKIEKLLAESLAATKTVTDTLTKLRFPVPTVPTDPLIKYTPADIDDAGTVQYFGYIAVGGDWYIRKFDTSTAPKTIRFCFGTGGAAAYNTAFTNRASQTYALWSQ